jgi:hypothetical protein
MQFNTPRRISCRDCCLDLNEDWFDCRLAIGAYDAFDVTWVDVFNHLVPRSIPISSAAKTLNGVYFLDNDDPV